MASGYPDWTRAIRLLGIDADGNPVTILADEDGKLYSLITGQDAGGVLRAVRVDDDGQMLMVPRGQSGNYMLVDAAGFLSAVIKGEKADTSLVNVAVDDDGQIVMVPRGITGNYMAIDADGYMTAVLKGAYGAALRTIGLDDEGRITAYMADAESQWGDVVTVGNAELAARLGSPVAWDWRGKVIWWTDFKQGLGGMDVYASGAGASVSLDPTHFLSGGYSAKIIGGSGAPLESYVGIAVDIPPTARVGLYIRWCSDSYFDYLDLLMELTDGTEFHDAALRYDKDNHRLYYLDSDGAFQSLASQVFDTDDYCWHGLKLVVDIDANTYARCLAGPSEHDMSSLAMRSFTSSSAQRIFCAVQIHSHSGNNEYAWIDSMVITVGEPE